MTQTVFGVIYCALLSSRVTGTCASSQSTVKVVTDCFRDKLEIGSKPSQHQNVLSTPPLRRLRRDARSKGSLAPFAPEDVRLSHVEGSPPAKTHPGVSGRAYPPSLCTPHFLLQFSLLRLSAGRGLVTQRPIVGTFSTSVRTSHSDSNEGTGLAESRRKEVLQPFRASMARLSASGSIQEAWDAFEGLRVSDNLSILPDDELLQFILRAHDSSLLSLSPPTILSRESAAAVGRLHDEILRRTESSPDPEKATFKTWLNSFALRTLLLAGKLERATEMVYDDFVASEVKGASPPFAYLQQLFIAFILRENLEGGLTVLTKFWPWICQHFEWDASIQDEHAEEFRRPILFAFKAIKDVHDLLQTFEDKDAQEVGAQILVFRSCAHDTPNEIHAVHRQFVSSRVPMSIDMHMQFFGALLSREAYAQAYAVRNHVHSTYPGRQVAPKVAAVLRLFPVIGPSDVREALSWMAETVTMERFSSVMKNPSAPRSDLLSIWEDVEASDCLVRRNRDDHRLLIVDYDLRVFAKAIIDNSCAKVGDLTIPNAEESADLLDRVCEVLKQRFLRLEGGIESKASQTKLVPMLCHSMILRGNLLPVRDMLFTERKGHLPDRTRTITQLFLASLRLESLPEAFEHIRVLWPMIARHVDDASGRFTTDEANKQSEQIRNTLFGVFGEIEDPAAWIASSLKTTEGRETAGHLFCHIFRERNEPDKALQLFNDFQTRKLPLTWHAHLVLLKLFLVEQHDAAARVHRSLLNHFPRETTVLELRDRDELHIGLRLYSVLGDVQRSEEYYNILYKRRWADKGARRRLLHAYSVNGNTQKARRLFSEFFVGTVKTPENRDFREIIYAHVRAGDMKGIHRWVDEMLKRGVQPDLDIFNLILLAFAISLDLDSATAVLQRMRDSRIRPDHVSYSTVMSIMSVNKDPVGAEKLYQLAIQEGVVPDDIMVFTLMNTHVEAGSWKGVIRAFDYLQQSERSSHLSVQLYNILLKAYVLIGAPFTTVYEIFQKYETLKMAPSEHTYALLIQSACDAGRMDAAMDIFHQLDAIAQGEGGVSHINIYVMTIIMAGYLRIGERDRAQGVYDDMTTRGIQPSAVTFGIIINAYANERSEESLRLAQEFMRSLFSAEESQRAWLGATAGGGRSKALDAVYGPLMTIHGQQLDVSAVEKYYDEMISMGGQPGLVNLTVLMDAYRRVGNLEGVQHVWGEIVKMALQTSRDDPFARLTAPAAAPALMPGEDAQTRPRKANVLCIPLSVYIDALSAAGRHLEIAQTWRTVKNQGFTFDAHNWNHLAVALVRAGEPERAFEIVERVILPYQRLAFSFVRTRRKAPSPLIFVGAQAADEAAEENESLPYQDPRSPSRRQDAIQGAAQHRGELSPLGEDPAQQLHELQQLSFSWQAWRPHRATLEVLGRALRRLEAGLRVRPEVQGLAPEEDTRRMSAEDAMQWRRAEQTEVAQIVRRIYRDFPNTVMEVERAEGERSLVRRDDETRSYS